MGDASGRAGSCRVAWLLWHRLEEKGTYPLGKQQVTGFLKEEHQYGGHIQSVAALRLGWRVARVVYVPWPQGSTLRAWVLGCVPPAWSGLQRMRGRYHFVDPELSICFIVVLFWVLGFVGWFFCCFFF